VLFSFVASSNFVPGTQIPVCQKCDTVISQCGIRFQQQHRNITFRHSSPIVAASADAAGANETRSINLMVI